MGFSTSGSLLVIFFGLFIALGSMYAATSNAGGEVTDAFTHQTDRITVIHDTDVEITDATWNESEDTLAVTVENTGSTTLSVAETTVLLDGEYVALSEFDTTVEGQQTDVWDVGETLHLETQTDQPVRIQTTTSTGVSTATGVEVSG